MSIVGIDEGGPECKLCTATDEMNLCPLGGECCCERFPDPNEGVDSEYCGECDCCPCGCDGDVEAYECGCDGPCDCGDCWDCHEDIDCVCEDCNTRRIDHPKWHYAGWSDKYVWEQIVLDYAGFSDRKSIMNRSGRVVDYNYKRIEEKCRDQVDADIDHRQGIVRSVRQQGDYS
jgi:hypothetical protein